MTVRALSWVVLIAALLSGLGGASGEALAKGKGKGKKAPSDNEADKAAIGALLDAQADGVQSCVMEHAIARGASEASITARVLINDRGELLDTQVDVHSDKAANAPSLKECVVKLLRGVRFPAPRSRAGLTDVRRTWKFATAPTGGKR